MQAWLLDYDRMVKLNSLKEITNPSMFDQGNIPTTDGLFSTEIFGLSTKERRTTFAYIDLKKHFINPKAYISLLRLNRNFESVVYSTKKFKIQNGQLVEDENGETGIDWLYKNWENFKFPKNSSKSRSERVDLLTTNKKDIIFTTKFLVVPAFYRDVNIQAAGSSSKGGKPNVPEINGLYSNIIRNVRAMEDATNMDFIVASITGKIQTLLVDVYNMLKSKIEKKNGYIRRSLLGKTPDYCARVVITATPYDKNTSEEQDINFYHVGVPLSYVCSDFTPFIINWVQSWFRTNIEAQKDQFPVIDAKGNTQYVRLKNPEAYYNEEFVEKALYRFVKNPAVRFDTIEIPIEDSDLERLGLKHKPTLRFHGLELGSVGNTVEKQMDTNRGREIHRELAWTDLFYRAAIDVTEDKHVWITRYPCLDYQGTFTTRITVISTRNTKPVIIDGKLYKKYPCIDPSVNKRQLDSIFRDTVNIPAIYLPALGGDHDGDQITVKSVMSQEANEECEEILMSKANLLTTQGKGLRKIGNEGIQTLYSSTKFR